MIVTVLAIGLKFDQSWLKCDTSTYRGTSMHCRSDEPCRTVNDKIHTPHTMHTMQMHIDVLVPKPRPVPFDTDQRSSITTHLHDTVTKSLSLVTDPHRQSPGWTTPAIIRHFNFDGSLVEVGIQLLSDFQRHIAQSLPDCGRR